jgi:hypothetical protein
MQRSVRRLHAHGASTLVGRRAEDARVVSAGKYKLDKISVAQRGEAHDAATALGSTTNPILVLRPVRTTGSVGCSVRMSVVQAVIRTSPLLSAALTDA